MTASAKHESGSSSAAMQPPKQSKTNLDEKIVDVIFFNFQKNCIPFFDVWFVQRGFLFFCDLQLLFWFFS
jgi:hypothetical protein